MQEIVLQGSLESRGDLDAHVEDIEFGNMAFPFDPAGEAPVVCQFHDEVGQPVKFVERVDVDDVRVVERRAGPGLAVERPHHFGVFHHFPLHHLQRDEPFQLHVERAEDRAHPAGGDDASQLELPHQDRQHHGMAALGARRRGEGFEVARDEVLRAAAPALRHAEGLARFKGW